MSDSEHRGDPNLSGKEITVDYLARVEGETAIRIKLKEEDVEELQLKIFEPPRFFEGFLVGRKFDEVGDIVSRICGICPVSHMTTAIQAIETAMGIVPSEQTKLLRHLMCISQNAASHIVHLYMFALPDYLGLASGIDMGNKYKKHVDRLVRMKETVNHLTAVIGGRALHPVTHMVGGFTCLPSQSQLKEAQEQLEAIVPDAEETVKLMADLAYPEFAIPSEYVALNSENNYAINQGRIVSTDGLDIAVADYQKHFQETQVPYAFAKRCRIKGHDSFMVGALARLNVKFNKLNAKTKELAKKIGFKARNHNPFYNNVAQALEVHHYILESIEILKSFEIKEEERRVRIRPGEAGAMTEAPRGLLYHAYAINRKGVVEKANIATPTSHNFLNIEKHLHQLVRQFSELSRDELRQLCEELVRAYDPCFSCSVH